MKDENNRADCTIRMLPFAYVRTPGRKALSCHKTGGGIFAVLTNTYVCDHGSRARPTAIGQSPYVNSKPRILAFHNVRWSQSQSPEYRLKQQHPEAATATAHVWQTLPSPFLHPLSYTQRAATHVSFRRRLPTMLPPVSKGFPLRGIFTVTLRLID